MVTRLLFLLLTSLALIASTHSGLVYGHTEVVKRAVSAANISGFRGATLAKDDVLTSCEVALIDEKAGYVAASCLNYNDNGSINTNTVYEVYFDNGGGGNTGKTTIRNDSIYKHPSFNSKTFANNIAVVAFDPVDDSTWKNPIAAYRKEWKETAFVMRELDNQDEIKWKTPNVHSQNSVDSGCSSASQLYKDNSDYLLCIKASTTSSQNSACSMPYTSAYGVGNSGMGIAALFSYSISSMDNMCNSTAEHFNYYTVLSYYDLFAKTVLGRDVNEYVEDTSGLNSLDRSASFQMKSVSLDDKVHAFGGDMYSPLNLFENVIIVSQGPQSSLTSTSFVSLTSTLFLSNSNSESDGADDGEDNLDDSESDNQDDNSDAKYKGMPKSTVIALACGISGGAIFIAVVLYLAITTYRTRKQRLQWSNGTERRQKDIRELYDELGGASVEKDSLPTYDELRHSYLLRNSVAMPDHSNARDIRSHSILFSDVRLPAGFNDDHITPAPTTTGTSHFYSDIPPPPPAKN
ncbi:hypothetical protein FB645_003694 [Coemansia sp. IMI 203386]|nr:hypothetical protein FB645_003694 [Coemansia sp. IMI 203386]